MPLNSSEFMAIDSCECVMHVGALTREQLGIFFLLIQKRRPLPEFHGDCWRCHKCTFESASLDEMACHLFDEHDEEPDEDFDDGDDDNFGSDFKPNNYGFDELPDYHNPYLEQLLN
jgi:hypothetical protein